MRTTRRVSALLLSFMIGLLALPPAPVWADPCGMVPPIFTGPGPAITRIGVQKTYVFHKDGVETFVIRPGFSGQVEQFGMLIPFPTPPAIRKVPDTIFAHVAAAIDPPEVVVDLRPDLPRSATVFFAAEADGALSIREMRRDQVTVLRQEAVGMYEVAVLDAGSASALKAWMDEHGYRYPDGMDAVCEEYVQQGWCFVAVKTQVGRKQGLDPRPGMRDTESRLTRGQTFDGSVQAMGFRFRSEELVLPMRLSTFNEGDLHNIVYVLADEPHRIRDIAPGTVVRQVPGEELYRNVTEPLPLRIFGGTEADIPAARLLTLPGERDPGAHNGFARDLFGADLLAVREGRLANPFEEREKQLLAIGERLGLRGEELDALHHQALAAERQRSVDDALVDLRDMTLTVIDGQFPREVLSRDNLHFESFTMAVGDNTPEKYDANQQGPAPRRGGLLIWDPLEDGHGSSPPFTTIALLFAGLALAGLLVRRSVRARAAVLSVMLVTLGFGFGSGVVASSRCFADVPAPTQIDELETRLIDALVEELRDPTQAPLAVDRLCRLGGPRVRHAFTDTARGGGDLVARGWAIIGLTELGAPGVDGILAQILVDGSAPPLVRTWAAAGRVRIASSVEQVLELSALRPGYPALERPLASRLIELLSTGGEIESATALLEFIDRVPELAQDLIEPILALGPAPLVKSLTQATNQNVRRRAAAFLATLGTRGRAAEVAECVVAAYRFQPGSGVEPWSGGPLFVPSIRWEREDAHDLAESLISWHVWADLRNRADLQKQIHNNLRSVQLARQAGYISLGWQQVDTVQWLDVWAKASGLEAVSALLAAQGVENDPRYASVLGPR